MSKDKCDECGSNNLRWGYTEQIINGVAQGRLKTDDVVTLFYLGCEECSETVSVMNCDEIVELLGEINHRSKKNETS